MTRTSTSEIRIGPQGRIVIPAPVRKVLGLKPGDTLTARVEGGCLILERRRDILARLRKEVEAIPPGVSLVQDLIADRRAEARREEEEWQKSRK